LRREEDSKLEKEEGELKMIIKYFGIFVS